MSALPVTKKEGWQRGKNGIGPRMKFMTSQLPCFVGKLSKKKADSNYSRVQNPGEGMWFFRDDELSGSHSACFFYF